MDQDKINQQLDTIYQNAREISIKKNTPIVIFSDMHLGDGSRRDDFLRNANMYMKILKRVLSGKRFLPSFKRRH
jgi:hypothetical protein